MHFEDILKAAISLPIDQRQRLADALRAASLRDAIIEETAALRADGAFARAEPLRGTLTRPDAPHISTEDLDDTLRQVRRAWEEEDDDYPNT